MPKKPEVYSRDPQILADLRREQLMRAYRKAQWAGGVETELPNKIPSLKIADSRLNERPSEALEKYLDRIKAIRGAIHFQAGKPVIAFDLEPKDTFAPDWEITAPIKITKDHRGANIVCHTVFEGAPYTLDIKQNPRAIANFQNGAGPNIGSFTMGMRPDGSWGMVLKASEGSVLLKAESLMVELLELEGSVCQYAYARIQADYMAQKILQGSHLDWLEAFKA